MESNTVKNKNYNGLEVAIIGMSGRFPGANNIYEFWNNLKQGIESITFLNDEDLKNEKVPVEYLNDPNYVNCIGGTLADKDKFDSQFFEYSPAEAFLMDPQIRIFHECVYEALNDGGYDPENFKGLIGLYGGASINPDWMAKAITSSEIENIGYYKAANVFNKDQMCTLISYKLNLRGPSITLNTTCSSSLVAIHLACQSILNGECDMALAGGVSIVTSKQKGYIYKEGMIISKDGHCNAFDAKAKGTIGGEGCGVVLLKGLDEAIKDKDHIYAIIKGTAVNNDGKLKLGYTAPSIEGQSKVIKMAHQIAEIDSSSISFVETHGTGTELGDPIEIEALKLAFATSKKNYCGIGSVKTNIGHLDAAAGVAGFIKTVLALSNKQLPPSLNFTKPNPKIDFENSPFYVNTKLKNLDFNYLPVRAGVSSFGIGGTNAHIILEDFNSNKDKEPKNDFQIISLSAKNQNSLLDQIKNLKEHLINNPDIGLKNVCYSLHKGRKEFSQRYSCTANSLQQLIDKLQKVENKEFNITTASKDNTPPIVFMFSGQGNQYINMSIDLYNSINEYKNQVDFCFDILKLINPYDYKSVLFSNDREQKSKINKTLYAQPLLFIIEYSLAKLLINWGVNPTALIGHSLGEYVAACLSGVFSLKDALFIISKRGELMESIPEGDMISIPLSESELGKYLNESVSLASMNTSSQCVLSGEIESIKLCERRLIADGVDVIRLKTSHAFHSYMMDSILNEFKECFRNVTINKPSIPIYLNYTGTISDDNTNLDAEYWLSHLRYSVKYERSLSQLLTNQSAILIEVGPGQSLSGFVKTHKSKTDNHLIVNTIRHFKNNINDVDFLYNTISFLWSHGIKINWEKFYKNQNTHTVSLPPYSFDKQRFWLDEISANIYSNRNNDRKDSIMKDPIDKWFYTPYWGQEMIQVTNNKLFGPILIFADIEGYYKNLLAILKENKCKFILIHSGDKSDFTNLERIVIRENIKEDYQLLFKKLKVANIVPRYIVHCWLIHQSLKEHLELDSVFINKGFYSLLFLLQGIIDTEFHDEIKLALLSNDLYKVVGNEKIRAEKAMAQALINVLHQEVPNVKCYSIDVEYLNLNDKVVRKQSQMLFNDLLLDIHNNNQIAYRNKNRWIKKYSRIELNGKSTIELKKNGVYLITGGLGKFALNLTEYLCEKYNSTVILVNRRNFPDKNNWGRIISEENSSEHLERIKILKRIIDSGGKVIVKNNVDISDFNSLRDTILKIEKELHINGVFHTAGETNNEIIFNTIETTTEIKCQQQFLPKVAGTYNLFKALKHCKPDFCLLTSSLSSVVGGIGFSAYAAANAYMDFFIQQINDEVDYPWISVNFDGLNFSMDKSENHMLINLQEGMHVVEQILKNSEIQNIAVSTWDMKLRQELWVEKGKLNEIEKPESKSNKIQRPDISVNYIEAGNETQARIASIFSDLIGYDKIGIDDSFFELGGDSLLTVSLLSKIHKVFNSRILIKDFFSNPTVRGIEILLDTNYNEFKEIKTIEKKEYYNLSSVQKRIYITSVLNEGNTNYNLAFLFKIKGLKDIKYLEEIFLELIYQHESLRTSFHVINGIPVQIIDEIKAFKIQKYIVETTENEIFLKEKVIGLIQPFKLDESPLIRAYQIDFNDEEYLMVDMHHIISDGITQNILSNDIIKILNNKKLVQCRIGYKDYSEWHNNFLKTKEYKKQENYWLNIFENNSINFDLPTDFTRNNERQFEAGSVIIRIDQEYENLQKLIMERNTNLFVMIQSLINILLSKYSSSEDVLIGTETAGRRHSDLNRIAGMFVGLMPLYNKVLPNYSFNEFLEKVKEKTLQNQDNQDYQFDDLVKKMGLAGKKGSNPLFSIILGLDNFSDLESKNYTRSTPNMDSLVLEYVDISSPLTNWDLRFGVNSFKNHIQIRITYTKSLFKQTTCERIGASLKKILNQVLLNPDIKIEDIIIDSRNCKIDKNPERNMDGDFSF
ncbi:MAG: hypothetical protein A2X00_10620 [Bacteroidetes bacterium GWE2_32_14]|nr:MAG: hypothetical protein A2X00_10620 [Bacteroidetes bacterium GWE2_32_14]